MRLHAAHAPRVRRLQAGADAAAGAVDAAVRAVWRQLLAVLRGGTPWPGVVRRAARLLRELPGVVAGTLQGRLARLYLRGHRAAVLTVRDAVPVERLAAAGRITGHERPGRTVQEASAPQLVSEGHHLGSGRGHRPDRGTALVLTEDEGGPDADAHQALLDLLFPPPPENDILRWLAQLVGLRPADWTLLGGDEVRLSPDALAHRLAFDLAQGLTPREAAANLLPYLEGSRVRARRAARTFGQHVLHAGQMEAWQGLGDLVEGYQIHAQLDRNTRPEHRRRDGTVYHVHPGPGQLGLDAMPRPPLEADGSVAWNCRCWLSPVLA